MMVECTAAIPACQGPHKPELFWRRAERCLDALTADPAAWSEIMAERTEWDAALVDGLDQY